MSLVHVTEPTSNDLKSRAGSARTLASSSYGLDAVCMTTLQTLQDTAAVGGGVAGRRVRLAGGCGDLDAHGVLVLHPGHQDVVCGAVEGVVLDDWSAGRCVWDTVTG